MNPRCSILPRLVVPFAFGVALVGCGSTAPDIADAPPLYRLALTEVAQPTTAETFSWPLRDEAPETQVMPSHAYTVSVRIERLPFVGAALQGIEGAEAITAPSLTVYPDQRANLSVIDQHAFIQDFDVEVPADGVYVADPIIGVLQNGMTIDLLVQDAEDGRVRLGFAVEQSESDAPHPERELRLGADATPVTIQLPAVEIRRTVGAVSAQLGTAVELFHWPSSDGRLVRAVASVERVELQDDLLDARTAYIRDDLDAERGRDDPTPDFRSDAFGEVDLRSLAAGAGEPAASSSTELRFVLLSDDDEAAVLGQAHAGPSTPADFEVLERFVWSSPRVPGSRYESRLMESYIADRVAVGSGAGSLFDPSVATVVSGVSATVRPDGRLQVEWVTTPVWPVASVDGVGADRPVSRIAGAVVPVTTSGVFVPLARTSDGRLAGVTVVGGP